MFKAMPKNLLSFVYKSLFIGLMGLFLACQNTQKTPPNIVLFFVDDLGWQDTSVPFWDKSTPLNQRYYTPNMERLRAKGVQFTNAYSTPVCSPSRISLMTGMNAARHRVTNWTLQPDVLQPMEINHPTLEFPQWNVNGLATSDSLPYTVYATPLPAILQQNGYHTIHVGKGHFGALGYPSADPRNIGFDQNIAGHAAGAPASYWGEEHFGNNQVNPPVWAVPGLENYHGQPIFLTEALTQEALKAVATATETKKPFFLYFSLYGVHTPLMANARFIDRYTALDLPQQEAKYASMIESMDHALGELLDYLDRNKLTNNTVVLFMSDNGGLSAVARGGEKHTHNAPLKSGKGAIYEGGIRVPMLGYWPGKTTTPRVIDQPLIIEDFFPTLLDIAGIDSPQTVQTIDGKSFAGLLQAQSSTSSHPLYWHYPNAWGPTGPGIGSFSAVRNDPWKLIYFHEDQHFELYNLKEDIGEQNDLAKEHPQRLAQLAQQLTAHLQATAAQMPRYKTTQQPVPYPTDALRQVYSE